MFHKPLYGDVYQQFFRKQETKILKGLGVKRFQIFRYYFYSGSVLGVIGIFAGSFCAIVSNGRVIEWIKKISNQKENIDLRFSDFNRSLQRKEIAFGSVVEWKHFAFMIGCLLFLCFLMIIIFTCLVNKQFRKKMKDRRQRKIEHRMNFYGIIGVALKHILREKFQTFGIILFGYIVIAYTGTLLHSMNLTQNRVEEFENTQSIKGHLVDYNGYLNTKLILDVNDLKQIASIPNIFKVTGSSVESYQFLGVSIKWDGTEKEYASLPVPLTSVENKAQGLRFLNGASVIFTNDIFSTQEFIYKEELRKEFLQGYSLDSLGEAYDGELIGMVSYDMAKEYGIELGDTIVVAVNRPGVGRFLREYNIRIIGLFERARLQNNIYCPLNTVMDISFTYDNALSNQRFAFGKFKEENYSLATVSFEVQGIGQLSNVKDALEEFGYAQISVASKERKFVMIEDGIYLHQYENLLKQEKYVTIFTGAMIILCMIANSVLAVLFIKRSSYTIGVMRGLGASCLQIYTIKFVEIGITYLIGNLLGGMILVINGVILVRLEIGIMLFVVFFFFGGFTLAFWKQNGQSLLRIVKGDGEK